MNKVNRIENLQTESGLIITKRVDCTLVSKYEYVFKRQTSPYNYETVYTDNVSFIISTEKLSFFHELLKEDTKLKIFFDIDFRGRLSIDYILQQFIDVMKYKLGKVVLEDFIILSATRPGKTSLHIISRKHYVESSVHHKALTENLNNFCKMEGYEWDFDTQIYRKNGLFRCMGSSKIGVEGSRLELYKNQGNVEFADTLVSYRDEEDFKLIDVYIPEKTGHIFRDDQPVNSNDEALVDKWLNDKPYLVRNGNRINRISRETRICEINKDDFHSTENMFWYKAGDCIYVQCWCSTEKLCIGKCEKPLLEELKVEPERLKRKCILVKGKYQDQKEFDEIVEKYDVIINKRNTGSGKTTSAINTLKSKYNKTLTITSRLSLIGQYEKDYQLISAQNMTHADLRMYKTGHFCVCINSLSRLTISMIDFDCVLIDEIRSCFRSFEMTDMPVYSKHMFLDKIEWAPKIIIADANITDRDIDFIEKLRSHDEVKLCVIDDVNKDPVYETYMYEKHSTVKQLMIDELNNGGKIMLAYNNKIDNADALCGVITDTMNQKQNDWIEKVINNIRSKVLKETKYININKFTRDSVNIDTLDEYDIIAYSPTWSEGVSITNIHNRKLYGLFTTQSSGVESISQQIRRPRNIKESHISLTFIKPTIPHFQNKDKYKEYAEQDSKLFNRMLSKLNTRRIKKISEKRSVIEIHEDELWNVHWNNVNDYCNDGYDAFNRLVQLLVNNKFKVYKSNTTKEISKDLFDEIQARKEYIEDTHIEEILKTSAYNSQEHHNMKKRGLRSREEWYRNEKYNILRSTGMLECNLTKQIVKEYLDVVNRSALYKMRDMIQFNYDEGKYHRKTINECIDEQIEKTRLDYWNTDSLARNTIATKLPVVKTYMYNKILRLIGFSGLYDPNPSNIDIEEFFNKNLEKINEYMKNCKLKPLEIKEFGKLLTLFKVFGFVIVENEGKYYQQCTLLGCKLFDMSGKYPSVINDRDLGSFNEDEWSHFFVNSKYECDVCGYSNNRNNEFKKHRCKVLHECCNCNKVDSPARLKQHQEKRTKCRDAMIIEHPYYSYQKCN